MHRGRTPPIAAILNYVRRRQRSPIVIFALITLTATVTSTTTTTTPAPRQHLLTESPPQLQPQLKILHHHHIRPSAIISADKASTASTMIHITTLNNVVPADASANTSVESEEETHHSVRESVIRKAHRQRRLHANVEVLLHHYGINGFVVSGSDSESGTTNPAPQLLEIVDEIESNTTTNNNKNNNTNSSMSLVSVVVVVDGNATMRLLYEKVPGNVGDASTTIKRHYSLALAIIPLLTVFGNALVIIAVCRERALQTVTNLLIVSLAVSDLLVAICVMSFAVYFEWNSFVWNLGPTLCNLYIGADVACSTASILNLLAISLDRYIAITHPLTYTQYGTSNNRALFSIFVVWAVSLGVGLPVFFGANNIEQNKEEFCEFTNPYFIIISSILSFFVPCALMITLYAVIFRRLRERERARSLRHLRRSRRDMSSAAAAAAVAKGGGANERIGSALISGARWHCQVGAYFKSRADQMMLELSLQTSSYPTLTPSASSDEITTTGATISRVMNGGGCAAFGTPSSLNTGAATVVSSVYYGCNSGNNNSSSNNDALSSTSSSQEHSFQQQQPNNNMLHPQQQYYYCLRRCNTIPLPNGSVAKPYDRNAARGVVKSKNNGAVVCDNGGGTVMNGGGGGGRTVALLQKCRQRMIGVAPRHSSTKSVVAANSLVARHSKLESSRRRHRNTSPTVMVPNCGKNKILPDLFSVDDNNNDNNKNNGYRTNETKCHNVVVEPSSPPESAQRFPPFGEHLAGLLPFIDSLSRTSLQSMLSDTVDCGRGGFVGKTGDEKNGDVTVVGTASALNGTTKKAAPPTLLTLVNVDAVRLGAGAVKLSNSFRGITPITERLAMRHCSFSSATMNANVSAATTATNHVTGRLTSVLVNGSPLLNTRLVISNDNNNNNNNNNNLLKSYNNNSNANHDGIGGICSSTSMLSVCSEDSLYNNKSDGRPATNALCECCAALWPTAATKRFPRRLCRRLKADRFIFRMSAADDKRQNGSVVTTAKADCRQMSSGESSFLTQIASLWQRVNAKRLRRRYEANRCVAASPLPAKVQSGGGVVATGSHHCNQHSTSRQLLKKASKQMKREQKATVTLAVVLAVFLVCWVPFFALHLTNAICMLATSSDNDQSYCVHFLATFLSTWLGYLNSSLNPLIYTVFDQRFRKAFRNILKCRR